MNSFPLGPQTPVVLSSIQVVGPNTLLRFDAEQVIDSDFLSFAPPVSAGA